MLEKAQVPALYNAMCSAIAACHRVDECKTMADKAEALATYYRQTKDTESQRLVHEIKLRAWRQMGNLLLGIDLRGCDTNWKKIRVIRWYYPIDIDYLTDNYITQAIKLGEISPPNFEASMNAVLNEGGGSVTKVIQASPEFKAEQKRRMAEARQKAEEADRKREEKARLRQEALAAREEFLRKSGKVPRKTKQPPQHKYLRWDCLMLRLAHDRLRKAAIERDLTMHEIMRDALNDWMIGRGYGELPDVVFEDRTDNGWDS